MTDHYFMLQTGRHHQIGQHWVGAGTIIYIKRLY